MTETISSMPEQQPRELTSDVLKIVVLSLATWFTLEVVLHGHLFHQDTHEDLLRADWCGKADYCVGASTSLSPIDQTGLWVRILSVLRDLGLSIGAIKSMTFMASAIGLATMGAAAARAFSWRAAIPAVAFAFWSLITGESLLVLWNPSIIPVFVFFQFAVFCNFIQAPRPRRFVLLAATTACAIATHPVIALLALVACLGVAIKQQTPRGAILSGCLMAFLLCLMLAAIGPATFGRNGLHIWNAIGASGLILALAAFAVLVLLAFRWLASADGTKQILWLSVLMALVVFGATITASYLRNRSHLLEQRYVFMATPFIGLFLAALSHRFQARLKRLKWSLEIAFIIFALSPISTLYKHTVDNNRASLTLDVFDPALAALTEAGLDRNHLWANLGGRSCHAIQEAAFVLGMPDGVLPDAQASGLTYLLPFNPGDKAAHWPGQWQRPDGSDIWVGRYRSFTRRDEVKICYEARTHSKLNCKTVRLHQGLPPRTPGWVGRAFPWSNQTGIRLEDETGQRIQPRSVSYEFTLNMPKHAEDRMLYIVNGWERDNLRYQFTTKHGAPPNNAGTSIRLNGSAAPRRNSVVIQQVIEPGSTNTTLYPPCLVEAPMKAPADWLVRMGVNRPGAQQ